MVHVLHVQCHVCCAMLCVCFDGLYSETSNSGLSEERTTSVQRTNRVPPIDTAI